MIILRSYIYRIHVDFMQLTIERLKASQRVTEILIGRRKLYTGYKVICSVGAIPAVEPISSARLLQVVLLYEIF